MNRSGYTEDCDDTLAAGRWRAQVANVIRGKRGQAFLRELAAALEAMPEKALISGQLIDGEGGCCAIGVVCKSRGVDVTGIDCYEPTEVADAVGIAHQLAAEIEYVNDEGYFWRWIGESPRQRWVRMRKWVESKILKVENDEEKD